MYLFLVLSWCWWEAYTLFPIISRFGEINSRLGQREFPFEGATGIARKPLISCAVFAAGRGLFGRNRKNFPVRREKPGTDSGAGSPERCDLPRPEPVDLNIPGPDRRD